MSKATYDPVNKVWGGPKVPSIYNPDQNLGQLILKVLRQTPDSVTQISADTGVSVTCQQMYDRSIKIAKYLTKCGLKEGDLIGIVAANTENLSPVVIACFTLGLPINPLSPIMNEKDIIQMFSMTKPKMIFCDAENVKVVQNAVNEMKSEAKILTVTDKVDGYESATVILKEMENERVIEFEFPSINSNSTAAIVCSSGSTGFPKGVCKSHKQIIMNFHQLWPSPHRGLPVFFQGSAIFWISGFYTLIASALYRCIRVCASKSLDPQQLVDTINKYKVSVLIVPPYILVSLLQLENLKPLESIQILFVGGAVVSEQLCKKFRPYLPNGNILSGYGCTEQDFLAIDYANVCNGSCGNVLYNVELKIVDPDGNSLGPNESGEIYLKIPINFSGYFGHPEKTVEAFNGDWFKTGDIGYFDDEQFLFVTGRTKELLKFNNYQITPSEIEAIINEIKGITSSCVVGVPEVHSGNDIIHAFIILEESSSLSDEFILKYVNDKVIVPKRIRGGVHIVDSFPLGATGKVDKMKIKEMARNLVK